MKLSLQQQQMYSENESNMMSAQQQGEVGNVFGIYFCNSCKNMMVPNKALGHNLQFVCPTCGALSLDFSKRMGDQCLLYSKELQVGSKKYHPEVDYIFDPTMPSVQIECPECGHNKAIYILTPDEGETKMIAKMICTSKMGNNMPKCGHIWDLQEEYLLQKTKVIID